MSIGFIKIMFVVGILMVVKGGDLFVDAAIWMARRTGISSGIIAATLVSAATTLPEFFVSTVASNEGFSEIAVGNALGSYICNIALIIGVCSLIRPIDIKSDFFGIKSVMMMSYMGIFFILSKNGMIGYKEGYFLISLIIFFIIINLFEHKVENRNKVKVKKKSFHKRAIITNGIKFSTGGVLIIYGAHLLVDSGVELANVLRIPKQVVSLTLLAIGTSIPELITGLTATIKNEPNISLGNILGANILNISVIMGASALVSEQGLIISKQTLTLDLPMAILVSLTFITAGIFKGRIGRFTGSILVISYIIYMFILF